MKVRNVCKYHKVVSHFASALKDLKLPSEVFLVNATKDLVSAVDVRQSELWKDLISTQEGSLRHLVSTNSNQVRASFPWASSQRL